MEEQAKEKYTKKNLRFIYHSPLVSILIFIIFIIVINFWGNLFMVDVYQEIDTYIIEYEREKSVLIVECSSDYDLIAKDDVVNIIYPSAEHILKGDVMEKKDNNILYIYIKGLRDIPEEEINEIIIQRYKGKENIKERLQI